MKLGKVEDVEEDSVSPKSLPGEKGSRSIFAAPGAALLPPAD